MFYLLEYSYGLIGRDNGRSQTPRQSYGSSGWKSGSDNLLNSETSGKRRVLADWTARWTKEQRKLERVVQLGTDPGSCQAVPEDTPPSRRVLNLHVRLRKAESTVLIQTRTGRVGLARFLDTRKVPGVMSAQCRCRAGEQTPQHMTLYFIEEAKRRRGLRTSSRVDYHQLIGTASGAKRLAE